MNAHEAQAVREAGDAIAFRWSRIVRQVRLATEPQALAEYLDEVTSWTSLFRGGPEFSAPFPMPGWGVA